MLSDLFTGHKKKIREESEKPEYDKYKEFRKWVADYNLFGTKNFRISSHWLEKNRSNYAVWIANGRGHYDLHSRRDTNAPAVELTPESKDFLDHLLSEIKGDIFTE